MTDLLDKDGEKGENGRKMRVGAEKGVFWRMGEKKLDWRVLAAWMARLASVIAPSYLISLF